MCLVRGFYSLPGALRRGPALLHTLECAPGQPRAAERRDHGAVPGRALHGEDIPLKGIARAGRRRPMSAYGENDTAVGSRTGDHRDTLHPCTGEHHADRDGKPRRRARRPTAASSRPKHGALLAHVVFAESPFRRLTQVSMPCFRVTCNRDRAAVTSSPRRLPRVAHCDTPQLQSRAAPAGESEGTSRAAGEVVWSGNRELQRSRELPTMPRRRASGSSRAAAGLRS
jgi:hypothetical protein